MFSIRQAFRSLFSPPLITLVAIFSLALGIGANAAIFTLFEKMVLRPLPVFEPDLLVNLSSPGPKSGSISSTGAGDVDAIFSYPMFRDLEREVAEQELGLTAIAAHRPMGANLSYEGTTLSASGSFVSGRYFEVLGLQPVVGRLFTSADDEVAGAHPLVVLSHRYWTSGFDSDPGVINKALVVNGKPLTIVGVAPRGFDGTTLGNEPKIFVPISMRAALTPRFDDFENRRSYWVYTFGRLAKGFSIESAMAALNGPYQSIVQDVELPLQEGMSDSAKERFAEKQLELAPGEGGQSEFRAEVSTPLLLLLAVTGFVLLIACANVSNLLLAKATNRSSEIAIRMSIGARRHQVVGQLLLESFLLSLLGAALGYIVAIWTLRGITAILPPEAASMMNLELSSVTWIFLGIMAVVTSLVGLFPALHCTRYDLVAAIRNQSGMVSRSRGAKRFRAAMTTVQIALSTALLISAGLFTQSLVKATQVDLGIDAQSLATFSVSPELNGYTPDEARSFFLRATEDLEAIPGVDQVTVAMVPMISGNNWGTNVSVEGFEADPDTDTHSRYNEVGPEYFSTVGIPLVAGREFTLSDDLEAPRVAIVNQTFAKQFGLGTDAVGKRMNFGQTEELEIEIVGLAQDAKYSSVTDETPPVFFVPYTQDAELGFISFYVRAKGSPSQLLQTVRSTFQRLDPNLPLEELKTMETQVEETLVIERVMSMLSAAFALLATILAAIGLYGVLAYAVAQRRREIGLRMALGADSRTVWGLVFKQLGWLTVPGLVLGLLGALAIGRLAQSILFEVAGHDPTVLTVALLLLIGVSFIAGWFPARRATQIDPMLVLRED